jgi:hypothetical protein
MPKHVGAENWNVLIKIHYFLVFLQTVLQDGRFNHQEFPNLSLVFLYNPPTESLLHILTLEGQQDIIISLHIHAAVLRISTKQTAKNINDASACR